MAFYKMKNILSFIMLVLLLIFPILSNATQCRSSKQVRIFKLMNKCPDNLIVNGKCTGIVDHVCALAAGGIDAPINMQWQSYTESKLKDRIETTIGGKAMFCNDSNSTKERKVFNCD